MDVWSPSVSQVVSGLFLVLYFWGRIGWEVRPADGVYKAYGTTATGYSSFPSAMVMETLGVLVVVVFSLGTASAASVSYAPSSL